jgi:hypothetical protein
MPQLFGIVHWFGRMVRETPQSYAGPSRARDGFLISIERALGLIPLFLPHFASK